MRTDHSLIELCVEYDIEPPSITTDAGRHVLKRLCEEADIELNDGEEYLMPHGARRGAGEVLVRTSGHAAAARALDNSEEVVREHYSHIEAGDLADQMTSAFEEADQNAGLSAERVNPLVNCAVDSDRMTRCLAPLQYVPASLPELIDVTR
nr:hypothetical protein [Halococcus thailandensis]